MTSNNLGWIATLFFFISVLGFLTASLSYRIEKLEQRIGVLERSKETNRDPGGDKLTFSNEATSESADKYNKE